MPITNCDETINSGPWLNGCYDCIHYYDVYGSVGNNPKLVDFTKCVAERNTITKTNCYAAYYTGPC